MDEAITLRRGEAADAATIRALTRAAYAKWVPLIGREPKPMGADYEAAVRAHRFDLLFVGEALAGLIETIDQGDRLLIENVAVDPAFQGCGLGTTLMDQAEQIAADLGHRLIWLYTNQRFSENIRLYERLGYRIDGEEDLGGGMVRVNMSKGLA
jgi:ribosomal protein S18 acetylase RimI-like enzyme